MERLHALTRDADEEENVFWIDDENDDFFVFSALSISNPDFPDDFEETKQTLPSFLRLLLELFEVLLVEEEEEAMRDDDKANMMRLVLV